MLGESKSEGPVLGELKPKGPKVGPDVIRKGAWSFFKSISGVRLCWELEEPKGPKGRLGGVHAAPGRVSALLSPAVAPDVDQVFLVVLSHTMH